LEKISHSQTASLMKKPRPIRPDFDLPPKGTLETLVLNLRNDGVMEKLIPELRRDFKRR
jgi:hypothetical protein